MKFTHIIFSFICLSFISCRKDRTCECSITDTGKTVTRTQTTAITLPIPPPLGPFPISPASDTTIAKNHSSTYVQKTTYTKVSKKSMRGNCPETFEEGYGDNNGSSTSPTSTITVTNSGTKKHSCEIK